MSKIHLNKGFTLIEIFVVISILMVIVAVSMFIDINSYRGDAFRSEVNLLGNTLQKARADALNNIDQNMHGVAIRPSGYDGYVIFEGNSYSDPARDTSKDENVEASYIVSFSPASPSEITFNQLSGDANFDGNITLTDPERNMSSVISINYEGKISW